MLVTLSVIQQLAQTLCYDASNAWYLEHTLSNTHSLYIYIHYRRIFLSLSSIYDGALFSDTNIMALHFLNTSGLIYYLKDKQHLMIVPAISLLCACIPVSTKQNRTS